MSELSERLSKVMNRLEEMEKTPSELTKDALLADLRTLYDAVKNMDTSNGQGPVTEEMEEAPEPAPVAEVETPEEPAPAPVAEVEPDAAPGSVAEEEEAPTPEPVAESAKEPAAKKPSMIGNADDAPKANDEHILAGQLGRKPLEDLRTGIPLNEKFGIIRSLFSGNASDFGDAVMKLNNAASRAEMKHYLTLLQQRFGWDLESEAYQTFSVYVERKMLTLETSDANADQ